MTRLITRPRSLALSPLLLLAIACPSEPPPSDAPKSTSSSEEPDPPVVEAPASPAPPKEPETTDEPWRTAATEAGTFELAWRSTTGKVPRNTDFDMDVTLTRGGAPCTGATVNVKGWMPDHNHGMVRTPQVTETGEGSYRVANMLLHMRGLWQITFEVFHEQAYDAVTFDLEL